MKDERMTEESRRKDLWKKPAKFANKVAKLGRVGVLPLPHTQSIIQDLFICMRKDRFL
jgi:hypothetical protein